MTNLDTTYLGLRLRSPLVASASPLTGHLDSLLALQRAGAAAVVLPSLFEEEVEEESMRLHERLEMGADSFPEAGDFFPAMEYDGIGPHKHVKLVEAAKDLLKIPVIASINGITPGGWVQYAQLMADAGADAIELNLYSVAANPWRSGAAVESGYLEVVRLVRGAVEVPLAVKLSPFLSATAHFARRVVEAGADGLVLFNRFYQPDIDLDTLDVLPRVELSDPRELRLPLRWLAILRPQLPSTSLAATTGVHSGLDAAKALLVGADVAMMTSALLRHGPSHLTRVEAELVAWLAEREYESVGQLRGSVSHHAATDPTGFERANYLRTLGTRGDESRNGGCAMERLSAQDLSMLWPDDVGWPQDIGALVILEGASLLGPDRRVPIDDVRQAIEARLHLVPRFRQRVLAPRRGLGWPLWVDAPTFDIADHVNVALVPPPGDEAQLLHVMEHLRRLPLDRSRPLWHMWFLPGISQGRVGLYVRVHHAIADGVAGVATLGAFLDTDPGGPALALGTPPWRAAPPPTTRALLRDNLRRRRTALAHALSTLAHAVTAARRVRAAWPALHETLAAGRVPRTSINRPIGPGRTFVVVRSQLDLIRRAARAHDATINDVLAAAVAGGLRDLLHGRGERVDVVLRAYVPVSLHREQPGQARGNRDGMMAISLPVGVPEPLARLRLIATETAERRKRTRPAAGTLLRSGLIQRAFLRMMAHQRWANAYIANVPGPPLPLYFAGAPVVEVFPMIPLMGNITLGVGALSYADQFNITTVADLDQCPDVEVFVQGIRDSLESLVGDRLRSTTRA